jgi:DNA polymerase-1
LKALIDGDILLYRCGFVTENEAEEYAKQVIDELIMRILDTTKSETYSMFLSCPRKDSFRAKLYPEYKANRTREKPIHYEYLKQHLLSSWNGQIAFEEEADDLIGIHLNEDSIAVTIDKDILYGLAGHKYNFVKEKMFYTSQEEALKFFYKQVLMGDSADNIIGLPKIGEVMALKLLEGLETEEEMFQQVRRQYLQHGFTEEQLLLNGRLLKIRTYEGELWQPPIGLKPDLNPS